MDIEKCRALMFAIEKGSLSAAAEALGYTPSGISRMIASLEDECGVILLKRNRNGAEATAECREILPHIETILKEEAAAREKLDRILGLEKGHVAVGSAYSYYYGWMAKAISEFRQIYPDITISITEGTSTDLTEMIEEGTLDLAIVSRREKITDWIPLRKDRIIAWVPKSHPAVAAGCFPIARLEKEPFIEMYPGSETDNSRMFTRCGIKINARLSATDNMAAYSMVAEGLGITTVNEIFAELFKGDRVEQLPLDPPQTVEIGITLQPVKNASPAIKRFVEFIKTILPE